jgi:hypothetical protein
MQPLPVLALCMPRITSIHLPQLFHFSPRSFSAILSTMAAVVLGAAVQPAIATGMDWHELEALIREERRAGNPVAGAIHSLQLDQNKITLLLSNLLDAEEVRSSAWAVLHLSAAILCTVLIMLFGAVHGAML